MSQLVPVFLNFATISKDIFPVFKLWLFPAHCSEHVNILFLLLTNVFVLLFYVYFNQTN